MFFRDEEIEELRRVIRDRDDELVTVSKKVLFFIESLSFVVFLSFVGKRKIINLRIIVRKESLRYLLANKISNSIVKLCLFHVLG